MVFLRKLFFKYGLIGPDLDLEENVLISIDQEGKIKEINTKVHLAITDNIPYYNSHLLVPKFINTHTHVGDAILKDLAYNKTLDEAVGENGLKFDIANIPKLDRVRAMRFALLEMIDCGISTCFDFRENGLQGILELLEASRDLPINVHILGRPQNSNKLEELVPYIKGLGLSTPIYYNKEEIQSFKLFVDNKNLWLGTHIAENNDVVLNAINKFGISDLQLALKYLKPNFLVHLTSLNHEELHSIPPDIFLIFCPRSNAYFSLGFPPVGYFLSNLEYKIGLGTDNVMVTPPNILEELRWTLYRLKEDNIHPSPSQALKMITTNPSSFFSLNTGIIQVGAWADLLAVNLQNPRTEYARDPSYSLLFHSNIPQDIDLDLFHGEVIVHEKLKM